MAALHHLELMVKNGLQFVNRLSQQYSLTLCGVRETDTLQQWVLRTGTAVFLVTQPRQREPFETYKSHHPGLHLQSAKYSRGIDTFFDVAISVKDIGRILKNISKIGGEILLPRTKISDSFGSCEKAMIKSCVGNIVHTLVNRGNYTGKFLPDFQDVAEVPRASSAFPIRHIDHITIVCQRGKVDNVLEWYENVFGFSRFLMNRSEKEDEGFVLDGDIGLRLKAMEYFQCAETMLAHDANATDGLKLVIAESLAGHDAKTNQVESFIEEHEGPGIQHIGLYTDNIVETATALRDLGVAMQIPPVLYYSHLGKLKEILSSGENLSLLRNNGILLDCEADLAVADSGQKRYLKQIFTKPIFDKKTFFLELIERQGASGFGTGNIAALWCLDELRDVQRKNKLDKLMEVRENG